ncbi:TonB-dependent receptor, partial [Lysobacter sp. 2RAB21]
MSRSHLQAPLALAIAFSLSAPALAAAPAEVADAPDPQATNLDHVVVQGQANGYKAANATTATKTDTPIGETPQAITVVTGEQMRDQGAQNVQDALNYAAGVRSEAYGLDSRGDWTLIRGSDPTEYLDGLRSAYNYYTSTTRTDPYMLERIEVLRGPQGSLFGRNTTAGIIKFDSIKPSQDYSGRMQASYGSYNTVSFDGGIGGPINDILSFRVSALYQHRDDWVDNTFTGPSADGTVTPKKDAMGGFDDRNLRVQLLLTPSENFSVLASAHARDYAGTSTLFLRNAIVKGSNKVDVPRDKVAFDEAGNNPQAYKTYGGSVKATYNFGEASLTSISAYETTSGYSRGDTDGGAAANFPVRGVPNGFGQSMGQVRDLDQFTQEFRLASEGDDALQWQVGAFYFDGRDTTDFYQRAWFLKGAARNPNNWVRLRNSNTSWAAFGQLSYKVTDALTLTAGLRETKDSKRTRLLKTADTVAGVSTYTGRRDVRMSDTQPSWD